MKCCSSVLSTESSTVSISASYVLTAEASARLPACTRHSCHRKCVPCRPSSSTLAGRIAGLCRGGIDYAHGFDARHAWEGDAFGESEAGVQLESVQAKCLDRDPDPSRFRLRDRHIHYLQAFYRPWFAQYPRALCFSCRSSDACEAPQTCEDPGDRFDKWRSCAWVMLWEKGPGIKSPFCLLPGQPWDSWIHAASTRCVQKIFLGSKCQGISFCGAIVLE